MKNVLWLLVFLCGCSHGFHREAVRGEGPLQVTDNEVANEFKRRPQLPKPFRLGVYFSNPSVIGLSDTVRTRWTAEEKAQFLDLAGQEVGEVIFISGDTFAETDLKSIRLTAARYGADAVLILGGSGEVISAPNNLGISYLFVLPAFFVHGNDVSSLFIARASIWDVRNEYLYVAAEAENEVTKGRPLLFPQQKENLFEARKTALESLRGELKKQLQAWK